MDSHAFAWPLELGIWTPMLQCCLSSWGYGLPRFGVAPRVGDTDSLGLPTFDFSPLHWEPLVL